MSVSIEPIECAYGFTISVCEASRTDAPHLWLKIHEEFGSLHSSVGMTAPLTLKEAARLRDQLDWLIDNHSQVEEQ